MKIHFVEDNTLSPDEVQIKASPLNKKIQKLIWQLEYLEEENPTSIPVKLKERIVMIKIEEIISISVQQASLTIKTIYIDYQTKERLYQFVDRLQNPDFVQISKFCVININRLQYLEDSFSGNMTAFLEREVKESVSRKFLPKLMERLGL